MSPILLGVKNSFKPHLVAIDKKQEKKIIRKKYKDIYMDF